jgi:hypothetical protein
MPTQPRAHTAADQGPEGESPQRNQGSRNGEAIGTGQGEPKEDDVAGHVGDEHLPEHQVAERIDETGHHGQGQQQGWEGAVRVVSGRHHCPPRICKRCAHLHTFHGASGCQPARH